jgi:hypothetical protein
MECFVAKWAATHSGENGSDFKESGAARWMGRLVPALLVL